jgi:hypothetical protein
MVLWVTSAPAAVRWDGVFLSTDFSNSLRVETSPSNPTSIALTSGGNVGIASNSTGTIRLQQSVIGQAAAVTPGIVASMLASAREHLKGSVGYATLADETSDHARIVGQSWNIRFPGVVDPLNTSSTDFTFTTSNFFPERTHQAADYYRAALRADPPNRQAANGLLRTYYERMAAMTYAGHNGAERAARIRLLFGDIDTEITVLERDTLSFYEQATDELKALTSRSLEAQLFDGSYIHTLNAALSTNRDRLTEAYTRALSYEADTVLRLGRIKQFNRYRNPFLDPAALPAVGTLVADLASRRHAIAERQLLLELGPELSAVARIELATARYLLDRVQVLESSIENGRIAFIATHDTGLGTATQPDIQYTFREYAPDYVPFHALTSLGGVTKRSHDQFLDIASGFLNRALSREETLDHLTRNFDLNETAHQQSLTEITNRYVGELGTLCGRIEAPGTGLVPDVALALFPRSERLRIHPYSSPGESLGEIGIQWSRIEQAQLDVETAERDLASLYSQMKVKTEISSEIVAGIENLADLFLANGDKLAAMDREAGDIQSKAIIDSAEASNRRSWLGTVVNLGVIASAAALTGGGSLAVQGAQTAAAVTASASAAGSLANGWQNSKNSKEAAQIQAKAQRKLAKINARRTAITTLERAAVQHQQAQQQLLLTAEAMHSLRLQAARQELAILLAEQRLASEVLALANLEGRVHFLLQELASALALQGSNPLKSPDYRLVRDLKLREAEDAFHLAHRWVYLAAKSVEYRVNTTDETTSLPLTIAAILRARNASALEIATAKLNDVLSSFYQEQNREVSGLTPNYISLRHHLVQRNVLTNDQDIATAELQPGGASSSQIWLQYLLGNTLTSGNGIRQRLILPFSTSLDLWPSSPDPKFRNPLFADDTHNDAIASPGIEIQFVGTGINMAGLASRFRLEYAGTSAMRQEVCAQTGGKRVRYWDTRRPDGSPYVAEGVPGVASTASWGTGATGFNEFSPANDRWILMIDGTSGQGASGNAQLLSQLEQVTDIRIRFWTSYFPSNQCP